MDISKLSDEAKNHSLEIGTFNVRWDFPGDKQRWKTRKDRFADIVREWSPDLLGLQEPLRDQLDDIRRLLPDYDDVGAGRDDGCQAGEFCPILFRRERLNILTSGTFWLSETPEVPGSRHWGNRITRICTWAHFRDRLSGQTFYFYNTHLDHESQQAREMGAALVMGRIDQRPSPDPVILTGDFNSLPDNPVIGQLSGSKSPVPVDAVRAASGAAAEQGTFHDFTGDAQGERIDYIFVSQQWKVCSGRVLTGNRQAPYASDHFPVAVTLTIPACPQA